MYENLPNDHVQRRSNNHTWTSKSTIHGVAVLHEVSEVKFSRMTFLI